MPVLLALVLAVAACRDPLPDFLGKLIDADSEKTVTAISRFSLDGATVYYVQHDCCDFYNDLYDVRGEFICSPDGGIAGDGDRRCPDFWSRATKRKVVWEARRQ